jgi:hypothetical protein
MALGVLSFVGKSNVELFKSSLTITLYAAHGSRHNVDGERFDKCDQHYQRVQELIIDMSRIVDGPQLTATGL